jgi:hypothetical protein
MPQSKSGQGQKWRWGRFSPRTSVSPANLHSIYFSIIIFIIIGGWQNRPGVAAVPIASQSKIKLQKRQVKARNLNLRCKLLINFEMFIKYQHFCNINMSFIQKPRYLSRNDI